MTELNTGVFDTESLTAMLNGFWGVMSDNIAPILVVAGVMIGVSFIFRKLGAAKNGRV